jgi:hypothetical protein
VVGVATVRWLSSQQGDRGYCQDDRGGVDGSGAGIGVGAGVTVAEQADGERAVGGGGWHRRAVAEVR